MQKKIYYKNKFILEKNMTCPVFWTNGLNLTMKFKKTLPFWRNT